MESRYLKQFEKLDPKQLPLRGNRILIEVLPKEEIKHGSLYMATSLEDHRSATEQNRAELGVVLAVGAGYINEETQEDVPMDINVGAVILISRMGLKIYSQFPGLKDYTKDTIALTRDTEVHVAWSSLAEYQTYKESLNAQ